MLLSFNDPKEECFVLFSVKPPISRNEISFYALAHQVRGTREKQNSAILKSAIGWVVPLFSRRLSRSVLPIWIIPLWYGTKYGNRRRRTEDADQLPIAWVSLISLPSSLGFPLQTYSSFPDSLGSEPLAIKRHTRTITWTTFLSAQKFVMYKHAQQLLWTNPWLLV